MKKLEVKKEDVIYNLNLIRNRLNDKAEIIAVVKANGMGLGLVSFSRFLIENGVTFLGVANTFEALELRENEINQDILMMSEVVDSEELTELLNRDIILTVGSLEEKKQIAEIAERLGKIARVHVKIDTGFARYRICLE
ncbi:MAG: alanine racemase [Clostridia bacterium]|nr:alanine racemase [Clostridia bacterium]